MKASDKEQQLIQRVAEIAQKYADEDKKILEGSLPELRREQKSEKNGFVKHTTTNKIPLKNKFINVDRCLGAGCIKSCDVKTIFL